MASAPSASIESLKRALLIGLGQRWLLHTKRIVGSQTLSEAMTLQVDPDRDEMALFVPQYWAVPYHEGHGPVEGKKMIFFPDKTKDPRTGGGKNYPVRASDIRPLTKEEFKELRGEYVVIRKRKRVEKGSQFYVRGARALVSEGDAERIVTATLDGFMRLEFPPVVEPAIILVV